VEQEVFEVLKEVLMTHTLPRFLTPLLLLTILFLSCAASAQTNESVDDESTDVDDSAPVARVARLSFVEGDVSFLRAGVTEWAPAVENLPLLAGDQIYAGPGARAEIQLDRGNYIRLSESSELTITELSATAAQFEITEGTVIMRIERLAAAFQRFEVDTPNTAVIVQKDGLYRFDVRDEKNSELIVHRGEAEVHPPLHEPVPAGDVPATVCSHSATRFSSSANEPTSWRRRTTPLAPFI
jgi:ferric-dicitrate binding protein FerR (iron transport regulator)